MNRGKKLLQELHDKLLVTNYDDFEAVRVTIEVPRGSFVKFEGDPRDGRVEFVSPLPCPFNYGYVAELPGADGDPLDAVVLGRRLSRGSVVDVPVRGIVRFFDDGCVDDKLICAHDPLTVVGIAGLRVAFTVYAWIRQLMNRAKGRKGRTAFVGIDRREAG